jgi:hypothetical protein
MHDLPSLALDVREAYEELKAAVASEPSSAGSRRRPARAAKRRPGK